MQTNCYLCGDLKAEMANGSLLCPRCEHDPRPNDPGMTMDQIAGWMERWTRYLAIVDEKGPV